MLLLKFLTRAGLGQVQGDQLSARACYVSATRESARVTRESLAVSTITMLNGKGCSNQLDNPRDESLTPHA
ncbi:unnamed protein product [Prunus armeniaca]